MACGKRVEEEQKGIIEISGVIIPVHIVQDLPNLILEAQNKEKQLPKGNIKNAGLKAKFKLKRDSHGKPK